MALVPTINIGRLLARGDKLTTAKLNAIVKSLVLQISGSVATSDLVDGAVTPAKASPGAWFYAPATLGGNIYTADYDPIDVTVYADGLWLTFKASAANPGAVTFNAGAGAKPLKKHGAQSDLAPGDIRAGQMVTVRYNTTIFAAGCWEVISLLGRVPLEHDFHAATKFSDGIRGLVPTPRATESVLFLSNQGDFRDAPAIAVAAIGSQTASSLYTTFLHHS